MKHRVLLLGVLTVLANQAFACNTTINQDLKSHGLTKLKLIEPLKQGSSDSLYASYDRKHNKRYEGQCLNNQQEGEWSSFYADGTKIRSEHYRNGLKEGASLAWRHDGTKASSLQYRQGEPDGPSIFWYPNGQKISEHHYQNGQLEGKSEEWYENGQRASLGYYKNHQPVGSWTTWDADGRISEQITY